LGFPAPLDAQLQTSLQPPAGAPRDAAIGLVLGQLSGAALAWMLSVNVPLLSIETKVGHFVSWHLGCGLMLFGSAVGISAALRRHGLIKDTAIYWGGAAALGGSAIQIAALVSLGTERNSPFAVSIEMLPVMLVALLAGINFGRVAARRRAFFIAVIILSLLANLLFATASLGIEPPSDSDWVFALPLVAATVAIWPLLQRVITDEPSVANEPADWRPRPVHPLFWVFAPLVLLSAVQPSTAGIALDLPSLVIPLAILLAWRFGLRGFRTVVLMVLPAFWFYMPLLLTWTTLAPLRAFLPGESQFTLPQWIAPITLDVAASALLIAALFARPALFWRMRATSQLPWWGVGALALALCVQVLVPGNLSTNERTPDRTVQVPLRLLTGRDVPSASDTLPSGTGSQRAQDKAPTVQAPIRQQAGQAETAQVAGTAEKNGAVPRRASSYGWCAPFGWSPATLVVLALFLLAITQVRRRAVFMLLAVGIAGLISIALGYGGIRSGTLPPLSSTTASGALVAYGVGRYFERISIESVGPTQHMSFKLPDYVVVVVLLLVVSGAIASDSIIPGAISFAILGAFPLEFANARATLVALAMLLAWTMGVRVGNSIRLRNAGFVGFLLFVFPWLPLFFRPQTGLVFPGLEMLHPLLAPFLLLALFIIGASCRNAIVRPAQEASIVAIRELEDEWLTTLRRWSASISERVQLAVQGARARVASVWPRTTPAKPKESTPGAAGSEQPVSVEVEPSGEALDLTDSPNRPPLESNAEGGLVKEAGGLRGRGDWSFTVAISRYPHAPSWPGAEAGAAEFNRWVTSPSGGGVPEQQTVIFAGAVEASAAQLERRLKRFIEQASYGKAQGSAPRRIYLYFAGYVFGERDEVSLIAADAEPGGDPGSVIDLKYWVDYMCTAGPFAEVVLFVDGRSIPIGYGPWPRSERLVPTSASNASYFSIIAERDGSSTEKDGSSDFALALVEGLRGSASNTSSRITGRSLRSYLSRRMSLEDPKIRTSIHYDGDFGMIIAEAASAAA
jgi:hypothetical protein